MLRDLSCELHITLGEVPDAVKKTHRKPPLRHPEWVTQRIVQVRPTWQPVQNSNPSLHLEIRDMLSMIATCSHVVEELPMAFERLTGLSLLRKAKNGSEV
ncbi:MAG: hypothetical protein CL445_06025 [Acidimicrobiaceae bacterium]|nr:hypothetical protein [Acidimicrobiaceae bacterium]